MHDNFKSFRKDRTLVACQITLVDGRTATVFNQPFQWPGSLSVLWPAQTEDGERGFFIDGKLLRFALDDECIGVEYSLGDQWLDELRNIYYGPLSDYSPIDESQMTEV